MTMVERLAQIIYFSSIIVLIILLMHPPRDVLSEHFQAERKAYEITNRTSSPGICPCWL